MSSRLFTLDRLVAAIRGTERYGISGRGRADHSALMLAARITLPHFSVSSAMSLPKSAGEPTSAVLPKSASRALIVELARPALISVFNVATISEGVCLGAPRPYHALYS